MYTNDQPGADPQSRILPLLPVLVVRPAGPHAGIGQLCSSDDEHLLGDRDPDAVGHGAETPVRVPEPAVGAVDMKIAANW